MDVVGRICRTYRVHLLTVTLVGLLGSAVTLTIPRAAGRFAEERAALEIRERLGISAVLLDLVALELPVDYATGSLMRTTGHRLLLDYRARLLH